MMNIRALFYGKAVALQCKHEHSHVGHVRSKPELFVPEFALPISTSSFLAVISQRGSVTTYDTWKS